MALEAVTAAHRLTYSENVAMAVQQKRSRFENAFTYQPNLKGRQARVIELFGAESAIIDGESNGDTPHIASRIEDVWCRPRHLEWGKILEKEDEIKAAIDYQSVAVQTGAATIARGKDAIMASAFFGARVVGQDGLTVEAFSNPGGNVPVNYVKSGGAVNSGLTFDKIVRGQSIMAANEVDIEQDQVFMAITNRQMEDLYTMVQFLSKDYREKTVVDDKERTVISFMGTTFIRWQSLPITGSNRRCPMWVKSGMHFAEFMPVETKLERNVAKKYRLHPYIETYVGATRSEDAKLVEILCLEA
jgi:hypothetical protein